MDSDELREDSRNLSRKVQHTHILFLKKRELSLNHFVCKSVWHAFLNNMIILINLYQLLTSSYLTRDEDPDQDPLIFGLPD